MAPGGAPADAPQPYTKAERLLNLLMALRGTQVGLDRGQLRAMVRGYDPDASEEAFVRMFERDKDELRAMGVPVVTLTDAAGSVTGYRIEGDWSLPPLDLDRAELAMLGLAARIWQRAELAPAALHALRKVEAQLGMASDPELPAPIAGLSADSPALTALITACSTRTPVAFAYRKAPEAPAEQRAVEPWGVVWWRGHWYLVGNDTDRGEVRIFRASRIEGSVRAMPEGQGYAVPADFDARAAIGRFTAADRQLLTVAVLPGSGASLRRSGSERGRADDGWDVLELPADDLRSGVAGVLALAPSARVVGPEEAVVEASRQLDSILAAHASPTPPAGRMLPTPGARTPGTVQFSRLLALVPWLAANSGVTVAEAAAHFGISEEQLRADLASVITSGADDWTLFDIQYWEDGGVIEVIDALDLDEPLTLTPDEGLALLVALHALAAVPGGHDRAVLDSVTAKVTVALGSSAPAPRSVAVRVDLPEDLVATVDAALARGRALELTYLGAVRDQVTERVVDPIDLVVVDGFGYLRAHCRTAEGLRLFRLDRMLDLRLSADAARPVAAAPASVEPMAVALSATGRRVVVDLPPGSPVLDRHPITRRWTLPEGWIRAELPVGDYAWARRLVLGAAGQVVLREPDWLAEQVLEAALAARHQLG
ncbi:MAG TPA: WYL domain-containing protein [Candidatus Nanopelagicales bacterium]